MSESPSFAELSEMDEAEREAYFQKRQEELEAAADEALQPSADEQEAFEALSGSVPTETVSFETANGDVTVEVRTTLGAEYEDKFDSLAQGGIDGFADVRAELSDIIAYLIEDEKFGNETVWRLYANEYGTPALVERFMEVSEPVMSQYENMSGFRSE